MENHRIDLHTHSIISDGTYRPAEIVQLAAEADVALLALSDHDAMDGVAEAQAAARAAGIAFLPAVELDTDFLEELHILGLDLNPEDDVLLHSLRQAAERRVERNRLMAERLAQIGCEIRPFLEMGGGTVTRMHFAKALVRGGFAPDTHEAFARYLRPGKPGFVTVRRNTPAEAIGIILRAGGVPVLAHPCHLHCDVHRLVAELVEAGLMGIEAYYPAATPGQIAQHVSLARQHGLLVTCGSDFHGENRPSVTLGCAYAPATELEDCYTFFQNRHKTAS